MPRTPVPSPELLAHLQQRLNQLAVLEPSIVFAWAAVADALFTQAYAKAPPRERSVIDGQQEQAFLWFRQPPASTAARSFEGMPSEPARRATTKARRPKGGR